MSNSTALFIVNLSDRLEKSVLECQAIRSQRYSRLYCRGTADNYWFDFLQLISWHSSLQLNLRVLIICRIRKLLDRLKRLYQTSLICRICLLSLRHRRLLLWPNFGLSIVYIWWATALRWLYWTPVQAIIQAFDQVEHYTILLRELRQHALGAQAACSGSSRSMLWEPTRHALGAQAACSRSLVSMLWLPTRHALGARML